MLNSFKKTLNSLAEGALRLLFNKQKKDVNKMERKNKLNDNGLKLSGVGAGKEKENKFLIKKKFNDYSKSIKSLSQKLKYNSNKVDIVGSFSYKNLIYYSDIDFLCIVKKKPKDERKAFIEFHKILKSIHEADNIYFTEFKLETKDGKKARYYTGDKFSNDSKFKTFYSNLSFAKIDFIIYNHHDNRFVEASVIYMFDISYNQKETIMNLNKDMVELEKEGNYYKMLKRLFAKTKYEGNKKLLSKLGYFFNSPTGKQYQLMNMFEAVKKLLETTKKMRKKDSRPILKLIKKVFSDNDVTIANYKQKIKNISKFINENAKQFIRREEIPIKKLTKKMSEKEHKMVDKLKKENEGGNEGEIEEEKEEEQEEI
jgi:hypothetical protein